MASPMGEAVLGARHRVPGHRPVRRPGPPAPRPAARRAPPRCTTAARRSSSTSARRPTSRRSTSSTSGRASPPSSGPVPLAAGSRLRTLRGTLVELRGTSAPPATTTSLVLDEPPAPGLADEVRELFPTAVEVVLAAADETGDGRRADRRPTPPAARRATCSPSTSPSTTSPTTALVRPVRRAGRRGDRRAATRPGPPSAGGRREARPPRGRGLHGVPHAHGGRLRRRRPVRPRRADRCGQDQHHRRHRPSPSTARCPGSTTAGGGAGHQPEPDRGPGPARLHRRRQALHRGAGRAGDRRPAAPPPRRPGSSAARRGAGRRRRRGDRRRRPRCSA